MKQYIFDSCLLSPIDLRDYTLGNISTSNLPETFELKMTHNIKNQGSVKSCVAHAIATILEYHDLNSARLSTNFIYGGQKTIYGQSGPGMYLRTACKLAVRYGNPTFNLCSGNTEVKKVYEQTSYSYNDKKVLKDAYKHKLKSYINLYANKNKIKYSIMNYGPVLGSVKWYKKYTFDGDKLIFDKTTKYGYHATVIYGWDKEGWLCQNSWGSRWGNKGLYKLPYNSGPKEAYCLIDDSTLSSLSEVVNPTYNIDLLEETFKIINKIISIFTKN